MKRKRSQNFGPTLRYHLNSIIYDNFYDGRYHKWENKNKVLRINPVPWLKKEYVLSTFIFVRPAIAIK